MEAYAHNVMTLMLTIINVNIPYHLHLK